MTLYQLSFQSIPDGKVKAIIKVLNKREDERMKFLTGKLKRKLKRLRISHYYIKTLKQCKSWNRSATGIVELTL